MEMMVLPLEIKQESKFEPSFKSLVIYQNEQTQVEERLYSYVCVVCLSNS